MDQHRFSYGAILQELERETGGALSAGTRGVLRLAVDGHRDQWRVTKYANPRIPFIVHPVGTARLAMKHLPSVPTVTDDRDVVLCVALAHDLLEDTRIDASQIEHAAGAKVRSYVEALTKPPAGVAGRTSEERNRAFVEQIVGAGPAAVFVKLCDSMHNLSRPTNTPVDLLEKQIEKARRQYATMLERCPLGETFARTYHEAVAVAEAALQQEKRFAHQTPPPNSLKDAIQECVGVSGGKVLELHDITAVLGRTCGADHVSIWRQSGRTSEVVTELTRSGGPARRAQIRGTGLCEGPQEFMTPPLPAAVAALAGDECAAVYVVPTWTAQDTTVLVVLGYAGEKPDWVSLPLATMQVQFLAHRLIVSEADRRAGLAAAAARLGMQLHPDIASRLGVMPSDLEHLQRWRTRCQQAMGVVDHLVDFFLLGSAEGLRLSGLIRVESRVKTADSILSKFLPPTERVWPEYEKVEDVAGVRVTCPTRSDLRPIEEFLVSDKAAAHGVRLHSTISPARRDYIASPTTGGYRAIHLILEVETRLGDEGTLAVPCEVQLRTMLQDVWAAISHATLYGADRQQRRRHGDKLRETAAALERCERLLEDLVLGE